MIRIGMVVSPDAYLSSVGSMIDAYALARNRRRHLFAEHEESEEPVPELEFRIMSIDGRPVHVGRTMSYDVDGAISSSDRFDFIWLPAFHFDEVDAMRQRLASSQRLIRWLQGQLAAGSIVGACGASTLYLIEGQLLEGRSVPFSRPMMSVVRAIFPRCRTHYDDKIADFGNILVTSGIANEFTLIADAMARTISPDSGRWLAAVTGVYRADDAHRAHDPLVAAAQVTLEYRYASDLAIADLARALSTTHQTLISRFKSVLGVTPKTYVQMLRLAAAQRMLVNSRRSIDEIARRVGYSDPRAFREMFRKHTGETASAWRRGRRRPPGKLLQ